MAICVHNPSQCVGLCVKNLANIPFVNGESFVLIIPLLTELSLTMFTFLLSSMSEGNSMPSAYSKPLIETICIEAVKARCIPDYKIIKLNPGTHINLINEHVGSACQQSTFIAPLLSKK